MLLKRGIEISCANMIKLVAEMIYVGGGLGKILVLFECW